MIYYLRVATDDDDFFEHRCIIERELATYGYDYIDATGSQIAFDPSGGSYRDFKSIVKDCADANNITVEEIKRCADPGLGLFNL